MVELKKKNVISVKTIRRRERLEEAVAGGLAHCSHHNYLLDHDDIWKHRCYMGNHGKSNCQYLRIENLSGVPF